MAEATTDIEIDPQMTMEAILNRVPSAQRALFQRYHIGGCSSCAYEPTDTLADVCRNKNILDVPEVIDFLRRAHELDQKMQVEPSEVKAWLDAGEDFTFLDVRSPDEIAIVAIPGAEPMDYTKSEEYMALPKDRKFVMACKTGARSLDVAAYFAGHQFTQVYSLKGGLDRWRETLDPTLADYE